MRDQIQEFFTLTRHLRQAVLGQLERQMHADMRQHFIVVIGLADTGHRASGEGIE